MTPNSAEERAGWPSGTIQSVVRAMRILEECAKHPDGVSSREIGTVLGLTVPTASHLMSTLRYCGYLTKTETRYSLSWRVGYLHGLLARHTTPSELAVRTMNQLVQLTGETCYISTWIDNDVVVTSVAEGRHLVRVGAPEVGMKGAAHARASGKALLAFGPADRLERYLADSTLEPYTPFTLTDRDALIGDVKRTRERGYGVDRQERFEGVCCVAVPLPSVDGRPTLAISVMVPESRFDAFLEQHLTALTDESIYT
jgi:DNA-binding IclR family transcriptional regulator